jgi:hypothetical protein
MFSALCRLNIDEIDMVRTMHSFHLIQAAVRKEECDGFRISVPVLAC